MAKRGGWNKKKNMVYFIFLVPLNPLYPILILHKIHINNLTISPLPPARTRSIS